MSFRERKIERRMKEEEMEVYRQWKRKEGNKEKNQPEKENGKMRARLGLVQ
jgi:hypothetical protein